MQDKHFIAAANIVK